MAEELWLAAYVLGFFGSVSFGYLILRFGLPDIRTLPDQFKFGLSGFLGIGIFTISFFASLAVSPLSLWAFLGGISILSALVIGMKNQFFASENIKVAIPSVKVEKAPRREVEIEKPKVLERRLFREKRRKKKEKIPLEKPEIIPLEEKKEEERIRERGRRRKTEKKGKAIVARGPRPGILTRRRRRYLERRGELIEEAKTDMLKPKLEVRPTVISPEEEIEVEEFKELGEGLDLSDLESIGSLEELSEISDVNLEDLGELDVSLESLAGLSETEKLPKEKGMGCPKCNSLKGTVVYCPYCGKGFCSNCADKVKREKGMIFYGCPHCSKEVIVKETATVKA